MPVNMDCITFNDYTGGHYLYVPAFPFNPNSYQSEYFSFSQFHFQINSSQVDHLCAYVFTLVCYSFLSQISRSETVN